MIRPVIRYVITDVHMGLGHAGLNEIIRAQAKKNELFAKAMRVEGGMVLFLNASRTAAKMYRENGEVIGYLRMPSGARLTEANLDLIPRTFGGSVEYASAAKNAFKKFFEVEKPSKVAARAALA